MTTAEVRTLTWTLGDRLRRARRQADLTQRQLAQAIGVSHALVGQWENDEAHPGDRLQLVAALLAKLANVTAESIVGEEPRPPSIEDQISAAISRLGRQPAGNSTESSVAHAA